MSNLLLSPQEVEAEAASQLLARRRARRKLIDFTKYTFPQYVADPFHVEMGEMLDAMIAGDVKRGMIFAPPQHGKLIADDTPVLTTKGWKTHGELLVGDYVIGREGNSVRVIWLSEKDYANREVEFTDGSIIQCHAAHEWVVFDRAKHRPTETILETDAMMKSGVWLGEQGKRGGRGRFQIDNQVCVELPSAELPLHPYVLGAWLGDGSTTKNCITHHPDDSVIVSKFEDLGFQRSSLIVHPTTGIHTSYFRQLYKPLKEIGLFGNKHIPDIYFSASVEQRLLLLAGLIDTDGYVYQTNGRITFSTANKRLAEDVSRLVCTLGWRVTQSWFKPIVSTSGIIGRQFVCQVTFNPTMLIPTVLKRKYLKRISPVIRKRSIRGIREINPVPGRCIQVEGGVYLVGAALIPTHNSEKASVRFPAKWLGDRADEPVIIASYAANLAHNKSRQVRDIIESREFRALYGDLSPMDVPVSTRDDQRAVDEWKLAQPHRGGLRAAGVGGGLSGHPAALAIIDDPFADWAEAQSPTIRRKVMEWYQSVLRVRVWEDGAILIIMTRWHEDDLAGQLLKGQAHKWEVLRFPAIAESQEERDKNNEYIGLSIGLPDPLGRKEGEPLAPNRFSKEALLEIKDDVGSMVWAAEYQQVPRPLEGNRFKRIWFEKVAEFPRVAKLFRYWDKGGTKDGGAFTAGVLLARHDGFTYIVDVVRGQWSAYEREAIIKQTAELDRDRFGHVKIYIEQEPGSGGKESAESTIRNLAGFSIERDLPSGDKDVRLEPFAAQAEAKNVFLVRGDWNHDWIEEMVAIPNGAYRDQADATAGAFNKSASSENKWNEVYGKMRGIRSKQNG